MRWQWPFCALLLASTAVAARAEGWQRPPRESETASARPSLTEVRRLLADRGAGQGVPTLGPIALAGFNSSRELEIGGGRRVVVVSCQLGGGLLAFDAGGALLAAVRTWEISQVQLADLDADGQDEIVTLQKDGAGTGISIWNYHLFGLDESGFRHLWSGVGTSMLALEEPAVTEEGFVRIEGPRLVHLVRRADGSRERAVYRLHDGALRLDSAEPAPAAVDPWLRIVASSGEIRLLVFDVCSPEHCWSQSHLQWLETDWSAADHDSGRGPAHRVVASCEVPELSYGTVVREAAWTGPLGGVLSAVIGPSHGGFEPHEVRIRPRAPCRYDVDRPQDAGPAPPEPLDESPAAVDEDVEPAGNGDDA